MVGRNQGAGRPDLSARSTWTALAIAFVYMGTFAVLYVLVPDLFMFGHAFGADPAQFAAIRSTTVVLLRFVAAYCMFDAMLIVFVSGIKGAGDTRFVLFTSVVASIALVLLSWAAVAHFGMGLSACWWIITLWIMAVGVIYLLRFVQGKWRTMHVIESDVVLKSDEFDAEPIAFIAKESVSTKAE